MQSDQPRVEEVASNNIAEREVQPPKPPKRRKKKVSFAVWWALHEAAELKISAESIKQQDSSLVTENESSAKTLETVDQKGDRQPPESESNEKNEVPFQTWSEEHVPADQEISAANIEKQNDSQVSVEEGIAGVQETVDIAEKEQPAKSEEQPTKTTRNKKKMIQFHIWLEKHASADLRTSAESTGTEDDSLVTEQESISETPETLEKTRMETPPIKGMNISGLPLGATKVRRSPRPQRRWCESAGNVTDTNGAPDEVDADAAAALQTAGVFVTEPFRRGEGLEQ
ncbi:PREDICTED: uncharacterized protein LOC106918937 [Poecilia mexicana]|uniref:uncharacterized protein LOC106918937 n=1 Tax=Poecilia mexicana TaxID=48701 RepID=UPI00072EA57E|nr:PREDICTED: uncharacterized protein LOC106918937 [Poecilia mexicana]